MSRRAVALAAACLCLAVGVLWPAASQAAAPAWMMTLTPMPANFAPGAQAEYLAIATNVGGAPTTGENIVVEATLPPGLDLVEATATNQDPASTEKPVCAAPPVVSCQTTELVRPGRALVMRIVLEVNAPVGTLDSEASVSGGGAEQEVSAVSHTAIQPGPLPFGFLGDLKAPLSEDDGKPALLAGSHPYQQSVTFGFPTENPGSGLTNAGHPRDIHVELPRGLLGNPAASQVLCTEAELVTIEPPGTGCPAESQVGVTEVTSLLGEVGVNIVFSDPLYNMVPPPGAVAELATDVNHAGIFVHLIARVRSDGDYGVEVSIRDTIAFGNQPIFSAQSQVWGNPTAEVHDEMRGFCIRSAATCPVPRLQTAFLTLPGHCPGQGLRFKALADSWEEPFPEHPLKQAEYESTSLTGAPVAVTDCAALEFEPSIQARPTTTLSDSPSGLKFQLHQPQDTSLDARAPATVKDVAIRFPAGLAVNAAQAAGLEACSEAEVGFKGEEEGQLRFSAEPQSCPDASKLGTVRVTSPLLVRRDPTTQEVEEDPETGEPALEALGGSIYLAEPFENPFNSLIGVYVAVEDEKTGIVAKLAGEGRLDPTSGQITTFFRENPQVPLEDVEATLFGGSRGAFITPPACGTYTTQADLVPWSAPEGKSASPTDGFQVSASPRGGACPTSEAALPHSPRLEAGTLSSAAGSFSPLIFKLSREDGTQRLGKVEASLPRGLSARLAGVGQCSEAAIAKARSREAPEQGSLEQADPSCPASSEIGVVNASAGAGPNPYYTQGHAYLAGPYKGAPLSVVAIAPAVAGPFDLGTVVVRSALYLDPVTAQARVVTDPVPAVIQGVPVDLRSVAVRAERPGFSLNPTSCAEKAFEGTALSTLGAPASLFERFQAGGCASLPFKPKLTARLFGPSNRGAHPRLRAIFTAKPGEANTARISFTFPRSEFIDQAHFRTICTRVQFAAKQCPAGSVYGSVRAISPLLDYPLEGPVYLRSSSHKLPDVVAALRGPAHQPIEIDAVGRVDSVGGGLRVRFESVPDAPVTKIIFNQQGGRKGLFQNSTNICQGVHRAALKLNGQNGKVHDTRPALKAQCKGKGKKAKGGRPGKR